MSEEMNNAPKSKSTFSQKLDNFFEISARKSNFKTEIIAGLTTFFAMCYIVIVNPDMISGGQRTVWNAVYIGGIIAAVIGTLLMAFLAKMPFAQAAGMGLNSFFMVCFLLTADDKIKGYQSGLVIILLSGIIFLILSATGVRSYIAKALPPCLKKAIPAGIGLFIAFIGFQHAGIVVADRYTLVGLADFTHWANAIPAITAFAGLMLIVILGHHKIKGNIIIGILASSVLYYLLSWTLPSVNNISVIQPFKDFIHYGVVSVFKPESWSNAFAGGVGAIFSAITLIISFCLVDMFDTVGTLYGTCSQANMLDENGDPINMDKCMLCDSIATVTGSMLGTSNVTTFVESSAGVAEGGRTGLVSVVVSICFLLCLFLSPVVTMIPNAATAPALIYVGVLMLRNIAEVDMQDLSSAVPAFLTLIMMPLTYSIANGIGIGTIAYTIVRLCSGKFDKKDIVVAIIAVIFAVRFGISFMGTYPQYVW